MRKQNVFRRRNTIHQAKSKHFPQGDSKDKIHPNPSHWTFSIP